MLCDTQTRTNNSREEEELCSKRAQKTFLSTRLRAALRGPAGSERNRQKVVFVSGPRLLRFLVESDNVRHHRNADTADRLQGWLVA